MYALRSRRAFLATALPGFACLLTLTGCGGGGNSQVINDPGFITGIRGQATVGPLFPAAQQKQSNTAPLSGVVVTVLAADGTERARQTTDKQGNYDILSLRPGVYTVQGLAPSGSQNFPVPPAAQTITLANYQFVVINLSYDTGVR